jgi:hypothetical protein
MATNTVAADALPQTGPTSAGIATIGAIILIIGLVIVVLSAVGVRKGWRAGRQVSSR